MEDTCTYGCCQDCGHDHSDGVDSQKGVIVTLGAAAVIFAAALILPVPQTAKVILYFISYMISGREVLLNAGKNISRCDFSFPVSSLVFQQFGIYFAPRGKGVMNRAYGLIVETKFLAAARKFAVYRYRRFS